MSTLARGGVRNRLAPAPSWGWRRLQNVHRGALVSDALLVRWLTGLLTILVLVGLLHVWFSAQARELSYDRMAAHEILRQLELEKRALEARLELLNRHERIEHIAVTQLNMVRPGSHQKRRLP